MDILTSIFPILVIFLIFYFLVIRPQSRAEAKRREFIRNLKKGDVVLLSSGIIGKIHDIETRTVIIEVSRDVRLKVLKDAIQGPYTEPPPQPQQKGAGKKEEEGKKSEGEKK